LDKGRRGITDKLKRRPKPLTAERLEKAALHYLERYAASSGKLRQVLTRRLIKAERDHRAEIGHDEIETLIARLLRAGILDDARFAEARARSLAARGLSRRAIVMRLRQAGLGEAEIEPALAALAEEGGSDFGRAVAFAKRRRLGPWRPAQPDDARRRKEMAAMARQGFALDIVRKIVEAESEAALEDALDAITER